MLRQWFATWFEQDQLSPAARPMTILEAGTRASHRAIAGVTSNESPARQVSDDHAGRARRMSESGGTAGDHQERLIQARVALCRNRARLRRMRRTMAASLLVTAVLHKVSDWLEFATAW